LQNKEIVIEDIDPTALLGVMNKNLKVLQGKFPELKIVARGSSILVTGENTKIAKLAAIIQAIAEHIKQYGSIKEVQLEALAEGRKLSVDSDSTGSVSENDIILHGNGGKVIKVKSPNQRVMVDMVEKNDVVFAIGPAGTGKTYTAVALAVRALKNREIKRIILARPAVEAGENLGFLPGDLKEKIDPYLRPLYDALDDMIAPDKLKQYIETRVIEIAPMAFMRGRTLDNAYVILDEAQNATDLQLKMFLTRMGPHAKFIITGDLTQIDLPRRTQSGLLKAVNILHGIKGINFTYLTFEDVVRHRLVKDIIKAYDHYNNPEQPVV
jgi:phosphate starvation-inducible PhoH-like protein